MQGGVGRGGGHGARRGVGGVIRNLETFKEDLAAARDARTEQWQIMASKSHGGGLLSFTCVLNHHKILNCTSLLHPSTPPNFRFPDQSSHRASSRTKGS